MIRGLWLVAYGAFCWVILAGAPTSAWAKVNTGVVTEGTLFAAASETSVPVTLPLTHTAVNAKVLGFVSRVSVRQTFSNPYKTPLEVLYVFPLPNRAAVSGLSMRVGSRVIKARIKTRAQAQGLYDKARKSGKRSALLDQERPNIFTQSVANIDPGADIHIELIYDVVLDYDAGVYEFVYPMVVGPRHIPGKALPRANKGSGRARDTNRVPDASRITPPLRSAGNRSGHELSMSVVFDPGAPMRTITSPTHKIVTQKIPGTHGVKVSIAQGDRIPNKDFVVRYTLASKRPPMRAFGARGALGGHFALLFDPAAARGAHVPASVDVYFVVDASATMSGEPLSLVKRGLRLALGKLGAHDTFRIIGLRDAKPFLSAGPLAKTPANVRRALSYVNGLKGGGAAGSVRGLAVALTAAKSPGRRRVVLLMTAGLVGNEAQVLATIGTNLASDARLFTLGVGASSNRYLIDRAARVGRGDAHYALLAEPVSKHMNAFLRRVHSPIVTNLAVQWGGLDVRGVSPENLPDVFAGRPLVLVGQYGRGGKGRVRVTGRVDGKAVTYRVPITLPRKRQGEGILGRLWARDRIRGLRLSAVGAAAVSNRAKVEKLALTYGLATKYTSFVAVERATTPAAGTGRTLLVPVEMPQGLSSPGVITDKDGLADDDKAPQPAPTAGVSLSSEAMLSSRVAREGRGKLTLGVGVGVGVRSGHGPASGSTSVGRLSVRARTLLTARYGVGAELAWQLPRLSVDDQFLHLLLNVRRRLLLRGLVDVSLGAGAAFGDGSAGLALSGNLQLRLPVGGPLDTGLSLRLDSSLMPGPSAAGATSASMGVWLAW